MHRNLLAELLFFKFGNNFAYHDYSRQNFFFVTETSWYLFFLINWRNSILFRNSIIQLSNYLVVPSGNLSVKSLQFDASYFKNLLI